MDSFPSSIKKSKIMKEIERHQCGKAVWLSGSSCSSVRHYSLNARLGGIEERLGKMITNGPSVIESSLAAFADLVYPPKVTSFRQFRLLITGAFFPSTVLSSAPSSLFRLSPIASTLDATAWCFSHDTVEEILEALVSIVSCFFLNLYDAVGHFN
ncbi:3-hydroxyisobutyryl-CoA hydrolase-like protein 2, mitochondrial, partial [Cucurbita argyrosperma subsp. sororia]